jgi:hypothetical protein
VPRFTVGGQRNYGDRVSELEDAIARLERAVARLEAACDPAKREAEAARISVVAAGVAQRVDAALAKLGQLLEREN